MARVCIDLGRVTSKYDCLLGANLHASLPVDRHVFAKRVRIWANANGLISPLNADNLADFEPGPPARWRFAANAGDSRTVEIGLSLAMLQGHNTTVLTLERSPDLGNIGASDAPIPLSLSLRIDLEDRNFHWETRRNGGADHHFTSQTQPLAGQPGFTFTPAPDRRLRVQATAGEFHAAPEWSENLPHPVEASRGQTPSGDGYSPGWFEIPLQPGDRVHVSISADAECPTPAELETSSKPQPWSVAPLPDAFAERLTAAARAFVVRRDHARSVIAGYPWFLDWGRDTLICARGLLSAGMTDEVRQLLLTFARFEEHGTLPNTIHGDNASNRDTSDAPLWFGIACEDWAAAEPGARGSAADRPPYNWVAGPGTRTIAEVLHSIGVHCQRGTPNGIRMDPDSALLWSPSHFTWMDTNHPAGTPREGYPVEIQVLWIRLLRQLQRLDVPHDGQAWATLADRAERAFLELFWLEPQGWLADVLIASPGVPACKAQAQDALRSNGLLAVSLGLLRGDRARRLVQAAARHLFIPGALRSLAPLPVNPPLAIHAADGRLLNVPDQPYWGRYEGDEDTSRKPAYHNGTAWVWTLPGFCEALALAWDRSPEAVAAARACLASTAPALDTGCLGQLPEVLDGDAPHQERGCDAQAWSVTETLRVWRLLNQTKSP
jgi:predicted glycogen debranching enzyme